MPAIADWLYIFVGGALALSALALLYVALFHDRSRGRRRCPKCWYDMTASPAPGTTCSECGYTAKRERKLHKTRRRWARSVPAAMLLIIGIAVLMTPHALRAGWTRFVPTTVLVLAAPWLEDRDTSSLANELVARVAREELRSWHWTILLHHWDSRQQAPWPADVELPEVWIAELPLYARSSTSIIGPFWARDARFGIAVVPVNGEVIRWNERLELTTYSLARAMQEEMNFLALGPPPANNRILGGRTNIGEILTSGEHELTFRLELHGLRAFRTGATAFPFTWRDAEPLPPPLATREIRKSIRMVYSIDDLMTRAEDDRLEESAREVLEIVPLHGPMQVYRLTRAFPRDYAIGGVAELYRDGELFGQARIWVERGGKVRVIRGDLGDSNWILQNEQLVRASQWTFRFRGGPEAIYDPDAKSYWAGEFEIELSPDARWHHWLHPKTSNTTEPRQ